MIKCWAWIFLMVIEMLGIGYLDHRFRESKIMDMILPCWGIVFAITACFFIGAFGNLVTSDYEKGDDK